MLDMLIEPEDAKYAITPYLHDVAGYFVILVKFIQDALSRYGHERGLGNSNPLYNGIILETKITYANQCFSHSLNLMGQQDTGFGKALDTAILALPSPPLELPDEFTFQVRMEDNASNKCMLYVLADNDSLSAALRAEATAVTMDYMQKHPERGGVITIPSERTIIRFHVDYASWTGHASVLLPEQNEINELLANQLLETCLERAKTATCRPLSFPRMAEFSICAENGEIKHLVPTIAEVLQLDSEYCMLVGLKFIAPLNRIISARKEYQQNPEDMKVASRYFGSLTRYGSKISKTLALSGVNFARAIVAKNPDSWQAHGILAGILSGYADAYKVRSELADEIIKEMKIHRELYFSNEPPEPESRPYTTRAERLTFGLITCLDLCGRTAEAIAEYDSDYFKPYKFYKAYVGYIIQMCEKIGDYESARRILEEAISQIDESHNDWQEFQLLLKSLE